MRVRLDTLLHCISLVLGATVIAVMAHAGEIDINCATLSPKWAFIKTLAIVPTALITAVSAFISFQDYRGEIIRAGKAQSDLAKMETEIEIKLLEKSASGTLMVDESQIAEWWKREDGIVKGVDDEWLSSFTKPASSTAKQ